MGQGPYKMRTGGSVHNSCQCLVKEAYLNRARIFPEISSDQEVDIEAKYRVF